MENTPNANPEKFSVMIVDEHYLEGLKGSFDEWSKTTLEVYEKRGLKRKKSGSGKRNMKNSSCILQINVKKSSLMLNTSGLS